MTYVRKHKWAPLFDPKPERRAPAREIALMQHGITLAYWHEWFLSGEGKKRAAQTRERHSAELIRQAKLPI